MRTRPWDSLGWIEHFCWGGGHRMHVTWEDDYRVTLGERESIAGSIRCVQRDGSSGGKAYQQCAERWGERVGDPAYGEAVRCFIAEEGHHADLLGRFMDGQAMARASNRWPDAIFRWVCERAGLELCVRVSLAADLVARVYYKALRECTLSPVLRQICTQILRDEAYHVQFQCGAIRRFQAGRPGWKRWGIQRMYRAFVMGTIFRVWFDHRRVFRAGGYTFIRFVGEMLCELEDALCLMNGQESWVRARADEELADQLLRRGLWN